MKSFLGACWALATLASGQEAQTKEPDKALSSLINIERDVRRLAWNANLTFSALDLYGSHAGAIAEHKTKLDELHNVISHKIRQQYSEELARVKGDAEELGRQLAALQSEKTQLKMEQEQADAQATIKQLVHRVKDDEVQISKAKQSTSTDDYWLLRSAKLEREVADLKKTKAGLQADKKDLVKMVQDQTLTLKSVKTMEDQTLMLKSQLEASQQALTMQKSLDETVGLGKNQMLMLKSQLEDFQK